MRAQKWGRVGTSVRSSVLAAVRHLPSVRWVSSGTLTRLLQRLAVVQYILSFLFLGPVCIILLIYLLYTSCWWITALYYLWLVYDWKTHKQAGRRWSWVRGWPVWTYLSGYFPIQLIKTHHLPPDKNYIFGYHPHGIFCFGALCNFGTEANGFSKKYPGITPFVATLSGNFLLPVAREYLMSTGVCPVTHDTIDFILSRNGTGNAIVIAVGGAAESLNTTPGVNQVTLKNRKGFVRKALKHGAALVPVFSFGENDTYQQVMFADGSWCRWLQKRLQKIVGFALCVIQGCSLLSADTWGVMPFPKPITSVVGEPISVPQISEPSADEVDRYHALYMASLQRLFDTEKTRFGLTQRDTLLMH
ncbi:diacylglycerol O-acyltransferase 2-like isoform X2 [Clupea harengus]|uniref:Acyltransferase n=1 Tax=Clupea harengus TaxID=7950 RepID=A0A8M1K8V7_CLUHA|nr:diacylglycerol O-acyltransferase 2-like isoform X2 [Clupea harengus]